MIQQLACRAGLCPECGRDGIPLQGEIDCEDAQVLGPESEGNRSAALLECCAQGTRDLGGEGWVVWCGGL
jgi:hypothetical protein